MYVLLVNVHKVVFNLVYDFKSVCMPSCLSQVHSYLFFLSCELLYQVYACNCVLNLAALVLTCSSFSKIELGVGAPSSRTIFECWAYTCAVMCLMSGVHLCRFLLRIPSVPFVLFVINSA